MASKGDFFIIIGFGVFLTPRGISFRPLFFLRINCVFFSPGYMRQILGFIEIPALFVF